LLWPPAYNVALVVMKYAIFVAFAPERLDTPVLHQQHGQVWACFLLINLNAHMLDIFLGNNCYVAGILQYISTKVLLYNILRPGLTIVRITQNS